MSDIKKRQVLLADKVLDAIYPIFQQSLMYENNEDSFFSIELSVPAIRKMYASQLSLVMELMNGQSND